MTPLLSRSCVRRHLVSVLLIAAGIVSAGSGRNMGVRADDPNPSKDEVARDFAFEKTKLSTTLDDFQKRYPKALRSRVPEKADEAAGVVLMYQQPEFAGGAWYRFFDGTLYQVKVHYTGKPLESLGGQKGLEDKLVERLGKPNDGTAKQGNVTVKRWHFPNVARRITLVHDNSARIANSYVELIDTKLLAALEVKKQKMKKEAKTGFDP